MAATETRDYKRAFFRGSRIFVKKGRKRPSRFVRIPTWTLKKDPSGDFETGVMFSERDIIETARAGYWADGTVFMRDKNVLVYCEGKLWMNGKEYRKK